MANVKKKIVHKKEAAAKVKPPRDKSRGFPNNNEKGETSPKPDKPASVPTIIGTSARLASPFIPAINRGAFWRRRVNPHFNFIIVVRLIILSSRRARIQINRRW
jgi:hypothetical protein